MRDGMFTVTPAECTEHHRLLRELAQAIDFLVKVQVSHATVMRIAGVGTTGHEQDLMAAGAVWTKARSSFAKHVMEHGC